MHKSLMKLVLKVEYSDLIFVYVFFHRCCNCYLPINSINHLKTSICNKLPQKVSHTLREKCRNTEFFFVRIFPHTYQKKLRIWKLFRVIAQADYFVALGMSQIWKKVLSIEDYVTDKIWWPTFLMISFQNSESLICVTKSPSGTLP